MEKTVKFFLIGYIIVEIVLILFGLIYVLYEGICYAGSVCRDLSEVWLEGFVLPVLFGILAPILFVIWYYYLKKK